MDFGAELTLCSHWPKKKIQFLSKSFRNSLRGTSHHLLGRSSEIYRPSRAFFPVCICTSSRKIEVTYVGCRLPQQRHKFVISFDLNVRLVLQSYCVAVKSQNYQHQDSDLSTFTCRVSITCFQRARERERPGSLFYIPQKAPYYSTVRTIIVLGCCSVLLPLTPL